jgi:aminobenzoyl-glutamate utilization protein B
MSRYHSQIMRPLLLTLFAATLLLAGDKAALLQKMDSQAPHYGDISRQIWQFAEVGYKENQSAGLLKSELRQAGFTLAEGTAGIPTAFTAT